MANLECHSRRYIIVLVLFFVVVGCSQSTAPDRRFVIEEAGAFLPMKGSLRDGLPDPVVRGIYVTDEFGRIENVWGVPSEGGFPAYPNPSSRTFHFGFNIVDETRITAWVIEAKPSSELTLDGLPEYAGGTFDVRDGATIKTLLQVQLPQGRHVVTWDGDNDEGIEVPDGLYRIIVRSDDGGVTWGDLLKGNPFSYRY